MSHLSSIGFAVTTPDGLRELARQALAQGEQIPGGAGHYVRWHLESGSELWIHVQEGGAVVGIEPHFAGPARMAVTLHERLARSPSALDGAFQAEAQAGAVQAPPFLFDVPDFARHTALTLPTATTLQLAAFAHSLQAYADPAAFAAAQEGQDAAFRPETLIPISLFAPDAEEEAARDAAAAFPELAELFADPAGPPEVPPVPEAVALLAGVVLETEVRLNPTSGAPFRTARLRTAGGEVDLVADPRVVQGEIVVGGVLYGDCWLSGRPLSG